MAENLKTALVIGGSLAGFSAAIELRKIGIQVDLVEQQLSCDSYDWQINLGSSVIRALKTLEVLDSVMNYGYFSDNIDIFHRDGSRLALINVPRLARHDVCAIGTINGPMLATVLASAALELGAHVRFGTSFSDITQDATGVNVSFSDGSNGRYDLVVGADGESSSVRNLVFPKARVRQYAGETILQTTLPKYSGISNPLIWLGNTVRVEITPFSPTKMSLSLISSTFYENKNSTGEILSLASQFLDQFDTPILKRVQTALLSHSSMSCRNHSGILMLRPWTCGRVTLIGNAAHMPIPNVALGDGLGIEDGIVLAKQLIQNLNIHNGLRVFEEQRWVRCRVAVENSIRLGEDCQTMADKTRYVDTIRNTLSILKWPI